MKDGRGNGAFDTVLGKEVGSRHPPALGEILRKNKIRTGKNMPIVQSTKVEVQLPMFVGTVSPQLWETGATNVRMKA